MAKSIDFLPVFSYILFVMEVDARTNWDVVVDISTLAGGAYLLKHVEGVPSRLGLATSALGAHLWCQQGGTSELKRRVYTISGALFRFMVLSEMWRDVNESAAFFDRIASFRGVACIGIYAYGEHRYQRDLWQGKRYALRAHRVMAGGPLLPIGPWLRRRAVANSIDCYALTLDLNQRVHFTEDQLKMTVDDYFDSNLFRTDAEVIHLLFETRVGTSTKWWVERLTDDQLLIAVEWVMPAPLEDGNSYNERHYYTDPESPLRDKMDLWARLEDCAALDERLGSKRLYQQLEARVKERRDHLERLQATAVAPKEARPDTEAEGDGFLALYAAENHGQIPQVDLERALGLMKEAGYARIVARLDALQLGTTDKMRTIIKETPGETLAGIRKIAARFPVELDEEIEVEEVVLEAPVEEPEEEQQIQFALPIQPNGIPAPPLLEQGIDWLLPGTLKCVGYGVAALALYESWRAGSGMAIFAGIAGGLKLGLYQRDKAIAWNAVKTMYKGALRANLPGPEASEDDKQAAIRAADRQYRQAFVEVANRAWVSMRSVRELMSNWPLASMLALEVCGLQARNLGPVGVASLWVLAVGIGMHELELATTGEDGNRVVEALQKQDPDGLSDEEKRAYEMIRPTL